MVSWVIIAVLVVLGYLFLKTKHVKHKIYTVLIIALLIFLYATTSKVIAENNIDIKTFSGMVSAGKLYFKWVGYAVNNAKTIVANAVKMDWAG